MVQAANPKYVDRVFTWTHWNLFCPIGKPPERPSGSLEHAGGSPEPAGKPLEPALQFISSLLTDFYIFWTRFHRVFSEVCQCSRLGSMTPRADFLRDSCRSRRSGFRRLNNRKSSPTGVDDSEIGNRQCLFRPLIFRCQITAAGLHQARASRPYRTPEYYTTDYQILHKIMLLENHTIHNSMAGSALPG